MRNTQSETVTLVVCHQVRPCRVPRYEVWLRRLITNASQCPGHLGVNVASSRQGSMAEFTCVLRFATLEQLRNWINSEQRRYLIAEVELLLHSGDQLEIAHDKAMWFAPRSDQEQRPYWKQACMNFLVILLVTLALSMLAPLLWQPLFQRTPWLGGYLPSNVMITLSIVLLVVYLFMPITARLFAAQKSENADPMSS